MRLEGLTNFAFKSYHFILAKKYQFKKSNFKGLKIAVKVANSSLFE